MPLVPTTLTALTSVGVPEVDHLPETDVRFTNVPALFACLDAITDSDIDSVTVADVAPSDYAAIDEEFQARGRKTRLFFLAEHKLLIITIPTRSHEKLHLLLYTGIEGQIQQMGLRRAWTASGATRFPGKDASSSSASQGEGDSGGMPSPERDGEDAWPTIVVEGGYTQSLESLRAKIRFWFARSAHSVKIVVLAKAFPEDKAQKRILIEQWQERDVSVAAARPGATATRLSSMLPSATLQQPVCIQTINIVWALPGVAYDEASPAQRRDPEAFNVPVGPSERDIVLLDDDLQWCASKVWYQ
ncbi:dead deah box dna helicase [Ophiostoma piceae UAMH 11346]|uniref:Dead deah box dna helicase n=1 Tax=Ophiostoma piceae (strain UAMH 11346) TaxID=1262450 RepID=S3CB11_OPHP1|nr:dead deah box dna helicase [Ophiostoma piceae UAMH 11346]